MESITDMNTEADTCEASGIVQCIFVCSPCSENSRISPATVSCSDCLEFYCHKCSDAHRSFKAFKSHQISRHDDLQTKQTCEPCANKDRMLKPRFYCIQCDEAQCNECATSHISQTMMQNHILISSTGDLHESFKPDDKPTNADITLGANLDKARRPGKPCVGQITIDHVSLTWDSPEELFEGHSFQLRYKECNTQAKWVFYPETLAHPTVILRNLKSRTRYVCQVRMVDNENEGPYSELSDPVETIMSAAEHLLTTSRDVTKPGKGIQIKKLHVTENSKARNDVAKTRNLVLGSDVGFQSRERTLLLIGATGTGKSTLVDGMINYIVGVKYDDPYRFTLVDLENDEKQLEVNQALSLTQWITCYTLHRQNGGRLDYKINIIDTPGFGDTRGIERDKEIVKQIHHLFSSVDETGVVYIDAVCFIIKAPDARLTPSQLYTFNSIMSLFGQDIKDNFAMLITFADGKCPPVLAALKEADLPHDEYFPFNNSGLFADNSGKNASDFSLLFWNMGCQSFEKFFAKLAKMETRSLKQTRDVLAHREKIEITMENLIPLVDGGLNKVEETRIEIRILDRYKTEIEDNKDFTYTVKETQQKLIELPTGEHVTNCLTCNFTCHKDCVFSDDKDKSKCCAMDTNGQCTQCPRKCRWDLHKNNPYRFELVQVEKVKTYAGKLETYRRAKGEKMTREKVVQRMQEEMAENENEILQMMEKINECNNELRKIALRPDPLSLLDHIDILIESEKQEKRPGFQGRIESLQTCRRQATIKDDIIRLNAGMKSTMTCTVEVKKSKGILATIQSSFNFVKFNKK